MSGHSKWATIKRKKAGIDQARGKIFTRITRELIISAREGGSDPVGNSRLALAISNAKAANMPKDNIERAIKKGSGELDEGDRYEEVSYEGYGPGGIAYFVETTTNNVNRTVGEIRHIFSKYGGNLGQNGSVAFLFEQKGILSFPLGNQDADELMLLAIDAGAEDVKIEDEMCEVTTLREELFAVKEALEEEGLSVESAELSMIPSTFVAVDAETARKNFILMEKLEENDDVSNVFSNMEMNEEALKVAEKM